MCKEDACEKDGRTHSPYRARYRITPQPVVLVLLWDATAGIPRRHGLALSRPEAPSSPCGLMQPPLTLGNNYTQCREAAPKLFPSLDKAVATTELKTEESILRPREKQSVRRSCAFGTSTCPVATHEPLWTAILLRFPVDLPLIICPCWFPLSHTQSFVN